MPIEKLNIQTKVDNAAKKKLVVSNEIGTNETLLANEVNAIVNKVNEVVDAYNFGAPITAFNFKTNVPTYADLPTEGNEVNDGYGVIEDGLVYVWNGEAFPAEGEGMDLGLKPYGLVKSGEFQAVNGDRIFSDLKKAGFRVLEQDENLISELTGSSKENSELWTPGYFWEDGSISNDSSNDWYCTRNFYPITIGVFNVHLTISGNACLIFYDKLKNPIGFYKNETAPTAYTFDIDCNIEDSVFFRICHNFTAEPTTDLLYFRPSDDYNTISENVFEFAGKIKDSDKYVAFLNQD